MRRGLLLFCVDGPTAMDLRLFLEAIWWFLDEATSFNGKSATEFLGERALGDLILNGEFPKGATDFSEKSLTSLTQTVLELLFLRRLW